MEYLNNALQSLGSQFGQGLPTVLGALLVLIIGFFVAKMVSKLITRLLRKTNIDEKIAIRFKSPYRLDKFVGKLFYYLIVVYTLIISLNLLGVQGVLAPLEGMLNKFVGYLPNIIGAGVITFAGYLIGKIASEATGFLSERLESFGDKVGFSSGSVSLTKIVKQVVFIIIFIPIFIVALDTLDMKAISEPATAMLSSLLTAIPKIIAAGLLLAIFYIVGKYVVSIVTDLLQNLGLDEFSEKLGLNSLIGNSSVSKIIGNTALFFIMFTGIIAASAKLELGQVEGILNDMFHVSGKIFFGLLILLIGIFISNIATKTLSSSKNSGILVPVIRFSVMGIFLAFSLHTMGVAESIVNLAFGLTLGAIAVAFALSFGLGGREAAGRQMDEFFKKLNKKE